MEIKKENKPFILSKLPKPTLLPSDYQNFDERIESFIRYVQGANTFVAVKYIYISYIAPSIVLYAIMFYIYINYQYICIFSPFS